MISNVCFHSPPPTMLDTKTSCMQPSARESETEPVCIDKLDPLEAFTCSKLTSSRCSMNLNNKFLSNNVQV